MDTNANLETPESDFTVTQHRIAYEVPRSSRTEYCVLVHTASGYLIMFFFSVNLKKYFDVVIIFLVSVNLLCDWLYSIEGSLLVGSRENQKFTETTACPSGLLTCLHPRVLAYSLDCPYVV